MVVSSYGRMIRALRAITNHTANEEPRWRHRGQELTTGYNPMWPDAPEHRPALEQPRTAAPTTTTTVRPSTPARE
jgi:hydrogenase small subunit